MLQYKLNIPKGSTYSIETLSNGNVNISVTGYIDDRNWQQHKSLADLLHEHKNPPYKGFVIFKFEPADIDTDDADNFINKYGDVKDTEMSDENTYAVYYEEADENSSFPRSVAKKANGLKVAKKYTATVTAPSRNPSVIDGWVVVTIPNFERFELNNENVKINVEDAVVAHKISDTSLDNTYAVLISTIQNGEQSFEDWYKIAQNKKWNKKSIEARPLRKDDFGVPKEKV